MQTKKGSFIESWSNVAVGFSINFGANIILLPVLWDANRPAHSAFVLGVVFTGISVVRSYFLRRVFNKIKANWNMTQAENKRLNQ